MQYILNTINYYISEFAEKVLDRCVEYSEHLDKKDPNMVLDFDMEFIDDTYVCTFWGNANCVKGNHVDRTQGTL